MLQTISAYAALINAALGVAILGVILNLAKKHSEVLKERLEGAKDQSDWNRERFEAEKAEKDKLHAENEKLRVTLQEALSSRGVTLSSIVSGASFIAEGKAEASLVREVAARLEQQRADDPSPTPEIDLELAKAEMAQGKWESAAKLFERYVAVYPDSFEVQFARGVAWANTRQDNPAALRAYNDAAALLPDNLEATYKARVFTYRGAMLKRLGRLEEAQGDLTFALGLLDDTSSGRELNDIYYNLAAISAMRDDKKSMLLYLTKITDRSYVAAVVSHMHDYFYRFASEPDLAAWLDSWR